MSVDDYPKVSDADLTDCTVTGHTAMQQGAGIVATGNSDVSNLTMTGGEISDNLVLTNGGGLWMDGGLLTLTGVTFSGNTMSPGSTSVTRLPWRFICV